MAHPNAAVVEKMFQAYGAGDVDVLAETLSEDVVFHMPGRGPLAGTFEGREAVLESFRRMEEAAGDTFQADLHSILADDDHVVVLIAESGEKEGRRYSWHETDVFHVRDGQIAEMWVLIDDLYGADEFFGTQQMSSA